MLIINDLEVNYSGRCLFSDVSFNLQPKLRYGIVGANGCGKSSLLRVISGEESAATGTIQAANKAKIGFLKQDHFKYEQDLILDVVLQGKPKLWSAMQEKQELLAKDVMDDATGLQLAKLEAIIAEQDGYIAETQAQTILTGLGIVEEKHIDEMSVLSGGFKLRVLLAQTLFSMPDILLLDEPTNHLDIVAIRWLEKFLCQDFKGVLLIVSHDHDFLNNIATNILDIDYRTISFYSGNYDDFIKQKNIAQEQKVIERKEAEGKIAHMQSYVDRFKAKASKAKQAQSRMKMIEKIEVSEVISSSRQAPNFRFNIKRPSGKEVLKVQGISKKYADCIILNNIKFVVNRNEKVGIIGPNGIGKSTLLKIIMQQLDPNSGSFEWGYETHRSYFAQDHHELLQKKISIYDWLHQEVQTADDKSIRNILGNLLFTKNDVHKKLSSLSGGEVARLLFAKIQLSQDNVLILDEPTNHFDMESIEALGKALKIYSGSVLLVSHNRHFLQAVCNRIIVITNNKIIDYNNYNHEEGLGLGLEDICQKHFDI